MASRSLSKLQTAKAELEATQPPLKGKLSTLELDVTDSASIAAAAEEVDKQYGQLDALINNAAVGNRDPDLKTRLTSSLTTNVVGPALVSAAFRPLLLKSSNPYSIYVSSGQGSLELASHNERQQLANAESYRVSKAALNMLAINEMIEYKAQGLKVFVMCPGFVRSNLRGTSEEQRSGWGKAGDPEESGEVLLEIVEGKRDGDSGKFIQKHGFYPW